MDLTRGLPWIVLVALAMLLTTCGRGEDVPASRPSVREHIGSLYGSLPGRYEPRAAPGTRAGCRDMWCTLYIELDGSDFTYESRDCWYEGRIEEDCNTFGSEWVVQDRGGMGPGFQAYPDYWLVLSYGDNTPELFAIEPDALVRLDEHGQATEERYVRVSSRPPD